MTDDRVLVEPAALAAALGHAMHQRGVSASPERVGRFAAALRLLPATSRQEVYWSARVTLVAGRDELGLFDEVFAAVFDAAGLEDPVDTRGDTTSPATRRETASRHGPTEPRSPEATAAPAVARPGDAETGGTGEREAVLAAASAEERLAGTAFADLDSDELLQVRRLVRRIALATPTRTTRRTRASSRPGERVDLRRTLRRARRTAGDPVTLVHRHRRDRRRRLVLICDVSGSMEPYTRVYLTLLQGAVAGTRAESFVFATRLTRLTRALAGKDVDAALARAAATAPDWAGGTRLAASLRAFLDDHGRRGLARGAVVVILSDGWATDDPADVARQMARLARLAHRVVWVNPRKAARGFEPLAGGMAAALPHCDDLVSGHSLQALEDVARAVARPGSGSGTSRRAQGVRSSSPQGLA